VPEDGVLALQSMGGPKKSRMTPFFDENASPGIVAG
jgi:hypothetical protein